MNNKIIDLSEDAVSLHAVSELLVIEKNKEKTEIPFSEIAAVVCSHPRVLLTQSVLSRLAAQGAVFITCDEKRMPASMLLPVETHFIQSERLQFQINASVPMQKRLWQQIVQAKIEAQGRVLLWLYGNDHGFFKISENVLSGDTNNMESFAAQKYWPLLFEDPHFRRDRNHGDQNRFLNYGYMVLRAFTARAVCAVGLHPSLGIHHHNRYDAFRLADDLMEPFRPIVDYTVVQILKNYSPYAPLGKEIKQQLLAPFIAEKFLVENEQRGLFDVLVRTASSLVDVYAGKRKQLSYLKWEREQ